MHSLIPPSVLSKQEKGFTPSPFPASPERCRLVWLHRACPAFSRLSPNIVREVCLFFVEPLELLYFHAKEMYRVHPVKKTKEWFFRVTCLRGPGNVNAAVLMGGQEVFMVLINCTSAYLDTPYYGFYRNAMSRVFGVSQDRIRCSLLYDQARECVYIFGGRAVVRLPQTQDTSRCEKFLPGTVSLEPLPCMLVPRSDFGVCWHQHCVYLCCGSHPTVEKFDPQTSVFTKVSDLSISEITVAFSYGEQLYIVEGDSVWQGDSRQWKKTQLRGRVPALASRNSPYASVAGHFCSFIVGYQCLTVDLRTLVVDYHRLDVKLR